MPLLPLGSDQLKIGDRLFQACSRLVCGQLVLIRFDVKSDGDEGPDDGANHIHPEEAFHFDFKQNPFFECCYN